MQHRLASRPEDEALRAREAELMLDRRVSPFAQTNTRDVAWRNGVMRSARIHETSGLARLLPHPAARWIQHLWLDDTPTRDLLAMLRDGPDLPLLRQLVVIGSYGSVELPLSRKFPRLEHLEVEGTALVPDNLDLPDLTRLHLRSAIPGPTAHAICAAPFPRLAELELWFDAPGHQGLSTDAITSLFARTDLTCLRKVRFDGAEPHIIQLLVGSAFASQLETIDLFGMFVTSEMATALTERRPRFPALQTLVINTQYIMAEPLARLHAAYGERLRTEPVARPFATWCP